MTQHIVIHFDTLLGCIKKKSKCGTKPPNPHAFPSIPNRTIDKGRLYVVLVPKIATIGDNI